MYRARAAARLFRGVHEIDANMYRIELDPVDCEYRSKCQMKSSREERVRDLIPDARDAVVKSRLTVNDGDPMRLGTDIEYVTMRGRVASLTKRSAQGHQALAMVLLRLDRAAAAPVHPVVRR